MSRSPAGVQCIRTLREPMRLPTVIISPPLATDEDARTWCDDREARLPALRALRAAAEAEHRSAFQTIGEAA